ncbi:MAG: CZB domain-containing protein [Planctomycetes bacterium]|nr:CZB domain-containing protein [Planctomycetota bacterium]
MDFSRFIAAHGEWKARLREAIDSGHSTWTVESVRSDNSCDFGKAFYALPQEQQNCERGRRVRERHAAFHVEAARVLELALSGRRDEANRAIASGSVFTSLSSELTRTLMEWQRREQG